MAEAGNPRPALWQTLFLERNQYSREDFYMHRTENLAIHPVTIDHWNGMKELFGEKGACGGCWCMWWRSKRSDFLHQKGEGNKKAMQEIIENGEIPGLIAYCGEKPIGWCAVSPREKFSGLGRSKILQPIDGRPVWSVICFFIARDFRNKGLSEDLLRAAIEFVRTQGGTIVEGYPVDPKKVPAPAVFVYTGLAAAFLKVGFVEYARRSPTRPIMRYHLNKE